MNAGGTVLYKLTTAKGEPVHGGSGSWSRPRGAKPGTWRKVTGKLVPCRNGLHVLRLQDIAQWLRPGTLWEVEVGPEVIDHGNKLVVREARLVRKVAVLDAKVLRLLACDLAEHVLPIFEKKRPGDLRPREAIAAARAYARGEIGGLFDRLRPALGDDPDGRGSAVSDADGSGRNGRPRLERAGRRGQPPDPSLEDPDGGSLEPWRRGRGAAQTSQWWWSVEPPVGRVAHGIPNRLDRLRGLGNAVVPQVVEVIGRQLIAALEVVA